ncbi:MAG TPA: hypothetical protein VIG32_10575 [Candidatus Baltobacteraceae bacterium]
MDKIYVASNGDTAFFMTFNSEAGPSRLDVYYFDRNLGRNAELVHKQYSMRVLERDSGYQERLASNGHPCGNWKIKMNGKIAAVFDDQGNGVLKMAEATPGQEAAIMKVLGDNLKLTRSYHGFAKPSAFFGPPPQLPKCS